MLKLPPKAFLLVICSLSIGTLPLIGCLGLSPAKEEVRLADEFAELREHSLSLEHLQKAAALDPDNPEIQSKIGQAYTGMDKYPEAIAQFKKLISEHPDYYEAYYYLWSTLLLTTEGEPAVTNLKLQIKSEAEELLRNHKPGDKLYAAVYRALKDISETDRAAEIKKILLEKYPDSKELEDLGQECFEDILSAGSDLKTRTPLAEIFIQEFPHHEMTDGAYRIALTYYWREAKDKDKVRELCLQWVKTHPADPLAFVTASRLYTNMEIDVPQAITWAREAVRLIKADKTAQPSWYDEWQYRDVVRLYEAYDALGWAYYKNKEWQKAEESLNRGLELQDFHNGLWYHLGRVYRETNRPEKALNAFVQALMCRDDIPELTADLKDLITQTNPALSDLNRDRLFSNLYQLYATREGVPYFVDVTEQAGLGKATGRRVAWGDYDNDGYQDLLVDGCHLWHNNGDGTFTEVTTQAGITGTYSGGVWADYNNDGFLDFFATGNGNALWRNNGNGTFTNVTKEMGFIPPESQTEGAAWGDYNRDGFVDLYWANYEKPGRPLGRGTPHSLWQNRRGASFKNVSLEAGIFSLEPMCGRGVAWGDYNNDGWPDIFVANYRLDPDYLWKNNGNGTFTNVAREVGVEGAPKKGYFGHGIGAAWGDYDNDGNLDLFVANLAHPRYIEFSNMSYLFKNQGAPDYHFSDFRQPAGIRYEETHSNPAWCDYDNDGFLDLYITSCYPDRPSFLYRQDKYNRFIDVTWLTGTRVTDGWGCAWADFNNDGAMDLAVSGKGKDGSYHIFLFRNETTKLLPNRHWLEVKLVGNDCNKSAIGARITVKTDKQQMMREVSGGSGTTCQDSLVQHFGLGEYKGEVTVTIRWPSPVRNNGDCGKTQTLTVKPDRIITVKEE